MTGKNPTSWQPAKGKRSRGWKHSLKLEQAKRTAKPRSQPKRTPSLPSLPWKKEE